MPIQRLTAGTPGGRTKAWEFVSQDTKFGNNIPNDVQIIILLVITRQHLNRSRKQSIERLNFRANTKRRAMEMFHAPSLTSGG